VLAEAPLSIHATCVAYGDIGILLRGASGSGKSSLAFRLIEDGATLVADDRVYMCRKNNTLHASCPPPLIGRLELRGLGLVRLPSVNETPVNLVCDMVDPDEVERLPARRWCEYLECRVRKIAFAPFLPNAVAVLRLAAHAAAGRVDSKTGAAVLNSDETHPGANPRHEHKGECS
jgi:serine kinase of HPr protein (carbohydrate metabolism regulator)